MFLSTLFSFNADNCAKAHSPNLFVVLVPDGYDDGFKQMLMVRMYLGTSTITDVKQSYLEKLARHLGLSGQKKLNRLEMISFISGQLLRRGLIKVNGTEINEKTIKIIDHDLP